MVDAVTDTKQPERGRSSAVVSERLSERVSIPPGFKRKVGFMK